MRLIDADELELRKFTAAGSMSEYGRGWNDALATVAENATTIEEEPVRHGRWIEKASEYYKEWQKAFGSDIFFEECEYFTDHIACSNCLKKYNYIDNDSTDEWKYCPNCGAKMENEV